MKEVQTLRKFVIFTLVILLVFSSIPYEKMNVKALSNNSLSEDQEVENETIEQQELIDYNNIEQLSEDKEIVTLRSENSKVYENDNGTYTAEVYLEPIHFLEENEWQEIENTFSYSKEDEVYTNSSNSFDVTFNQEPSYKDNSIFSYTIGEKVVTISAVDDTDSDDPDTHTDIQPIKATSEENKITYENLYPGVKFEYILDGSRIKENIILDSYNGKNVFKFNIHAEGVLPQTREDGSIEFLDKGTKEFLFYIQSPFMFDSNQENDEISLDVSQEIIEVSEDTFTLVITASEEYLSHPDRVYPVIIDPWLDLFYPQDTFLSSARPTDNYHNLDFMSVGHTDYYGNTRSIMKWNQLPTIPNAEIVDAKLGINIFENNDTGTPSLHLHRITSNFSDIKTLRWDTMPSFLTTPVASINQFNINSSWPTYLNVTSLVKGWYNNEFPNYGFILKQTSAEESAKKKNHRFRTSEWNNPNGSIIGKPKLVITYRPKELLGLTDYWTYTPDLFQGEGTAVVNVINGNVVYDINVLNLPSKTDAFNLKMVYNSRSYHSGNYGYGWTFSGQRHLMPNSDKSIVEYVDGNGTRYHFNKQQHDSTNSYSAPEGVFLNLEKTPTGYKMTDPSETAYYFDEEGKNTSIVDEKGNTIHYGFNSSKKLITISESFNGTPGRSISLVYRTDNGMLDKIKDFRGTETSFTYESVNTKTRLKSITFASNRTDLQKKLVGFNYNPNHYLTEVLDALGNKGAFEYDASNRATKIIDPRSTSYFASITYPSSSTTIFKDARGHQTHYKHDNHENKATANVIEITEDFGGTTAATTKYEWYRNTITKVTEPDSISGASSGAVSTAEYDNKGNVTEVVEPNNIKVTNNYDDKSNLTKEMLINGSFEEHIYDAKSNLVSTSNNYRETDYNTYDVYGNIVSNATPTRLTHNRIKNSNFELSATNGLPKYWTKRSIGQYSISSDAPKGNQSAKISLSSSEDAGYLSQIFPVDPDESDKAYTISSFIKTENLTGDGAQLRLYFLDSQNKTITDAQGVSIRHFTPTIKGTQGWTQISDFIKAPSNTASIRVDLLVTGTGSASFDAIQVMYGRVVDTYYSNENAGMEWDIADSWTLNSINTAIDGLTTERKRRGLQSFKIHGSSGKRFIGQELPIKGKANTPITFSGWAYATHAVPYAKDKEFELRMWLRHPDNTESGPYSIPFQPDVLNQWQFAKKTIFADKEIISAKIYAIFNGQQTGEVFFDNIKVEENGSTSETFYKDGNFVEKQLNSLNNATNYEYDNNGNKIKFTNSTGKHLAYDYDFLDRLTRISIVDPNSANSIHTNYHFDNQGNLKQRIEPRGYITDFEYNAVNQVTKETDPEGKFIQYDYDEAGNTKLVERGKGSSILSKVEYKYDRKDQQTETWVNGLKLFTNEYDKVGNIKKQILANQQAYVYKYDDNKRVKMAQEPSGIKLVNVYDTVETSLSNGLRKTMIETVGNASFTTSYNHDILGRVTDVTAPGSGKLEFHYDEKSNPVRVKYGSTNYYQEFDENGLYKQQTLVGLEQHQFKYLYKSDGNMQSYTDGATTQEFTYDFAGRLETWKHKGTQVNYQYDKSGNLLNPNGKSLSFNKANEVATFTYDNAGQLVKDDKYSYLWDGLGQLTEVKNLSGSTLSSYTYHPNGLRKSKKVGSNTFNYHYDGTELIRITNTNNVTVWSFTWLSGKPVSMTNQQGTTFYYVTNYRGDVSKIIDTTGKTVASYEYDPWGNVLAANEQTSVSGQPLRYAGYVYDTETKLYYLQARYYDPSLGRFLSRDPDIGDSDDPITQNGYVYADNNPVMMVDPDGQWAWLAVNAAFAIYDGYKTYKAGGNKKQVAWAVASNFIKIGKIKKIAKFSNGPLGKANRKKQGREINEKKKKNPKFVSRSNKDSNRKMKKHTPGRGHKKGKK
ncbi:DNRLRE domain-containing protein [Sutcliffiella horikoshii]|uniref:DNRLRE domain-containing protein n=1 Tax=Sutcliffiella horikoshii TaxID=79883 RepID=A0A5D4SLS3_9BACI|nr:DNRLRE domain-containing protein [Sutcliffiella horikoshii]TYS63661.1 DNRLRE domain-containing protein [Sutcliffiella horikoshii]